MLSPYVGTPSVKDGVGLFSHVGISFVKKGVGLFLPVGISFVTEGVGLSSEWPRLPRVESSLVSAGGGGLFPVMVMPVLTASGGLMPKS